jgi:uncharacterized protein (DUF302 family)
MENQIIVSHQQVPLKSAYERFTDRLENKVLKHLEANWADKLKADKSSFEAYIMSLEGDTGLMLFRIDQHGYLLNVIGRPRKAKQYLIGNPMTATRMTGHDIRAALYAPLRVLVYEDLDRHSFVEYDLPSSLFCQFGNSQVAEVGKELDRKILDVIDKCDTPV